MRLEEDVEGLDEDARVYGAVEDQTDDAEPGKKLHGRRIAIHELAFRREVSAGVLGRGKGVIMERTLGRVVSMARLCDSPAVMGPRILDSFWTCQSRVRAS